ncbi:calpain-1 catalytic subunit [Lampris incognitus]|uniref:calpain-1 catalytic subunit n=1 Tax=Lampris incognitus TaxID=2546036 RepID=UPI0024B5C4C1|nr:calpain-1 catalytic subunit [Lampris incognitus]
MTESGTCTGIINLRYQDGSVGSPSNPAKFNNQDYDQLKYYNQRRRRLFVDNTFPPNRSSLGDLPDLTQWQEEEVEWLRPVDILKLLNVRKELTFFEEGTSRFDFGQGKVGNCWFLAAIASLTFKKDLMVQVVPLGQNFRDYAGIFHFRFWRFGKWVDVVIDDYLPIYREQFPTLQNLFLSVHSKGGNEFWAPLLEKAYAKICGSYADMIAGLPSEAFKDFSGGVHMTYNLREAHSATHDVELWASLMRAAHCKSMICCGTQEGVDARSQNGLVDFHAYCVTGVTEVVHRGSKVKLVRLFNPWGHHEWNGNWSDGSKLWDEVNSQDRAKCLERDDGEFWMELEDFCYCFYLMSICCENPNFIDGDLNCQWKCMIYDGQWEMGRTAGGSVNQDSFSTNPQYRIMVMNIDRKEHQDKNIVLSLMQKPAQRFRKKTRYIPIGLTVFQVPPGTPQGRLGTEFFRRNRPVKRRQVYAYERELVELHSLQPGEYVIVPSTVKPNKTAEFVLTIYSKTDSEIKPHDGDDHDDHADEHNVTPEPADHGHDTDPVRDIFKRYADQNGELGDRQLQKLLNDNFPHGFDWSTCRRMITMVDTKRRGKMAYDEFLNLWNKIEEFKKLFSRSDVSQTGTLSFDELQNAIQSAGIDVNDGMIFHLMFRYSGSFTAISLEDFITLMIHLTNMSNVFKNIASDGVINMDWNEWTKLVAHM